MSYTYIVTCQWDGVSSNYTLKTETAGHIFHTLTCEWASLCSKELFILGGIPESGTFCLACFDWPSSRYLLCLFEFQSAFLRCFIHRILIIYTELHPKGVAGCGKCNQFTKQPSLTVEKISWKNAEIWKWVPDICSVMNVPSTKSYKPLNWQGKLPWSVGRAL